MDAQPQDEQRLRELRKRSLGLTLPDAVAAQSVVPGVQKFSAEKAIRTHSVFSSQAVSDATASGKAWRLASTPQGKPHAWTLFAALRAE